MALSRGNLLKSDLDEVLYTVDSFEEFRNSRILILGGTGFVGTWLVSSLLHANEYFDLKLSINIITRNIESAQNKLSLNQNDPIIFMESDLKDSTFVFESPFDYYVHAATPSLIATGSNDPEMVSAASLGGAELISRSILKFQNSPSVIHTSSGAVYGKQSFDEANKLEVSLNKSLVLNNDYAKTKRATEEFLNNFSVNSTARISNPRLYAFAGPRIELNEHFAIGNFVRDGISAEEINVKGNPSTIRSYLYPTESTSWLIKLMASPSTENINIGSEMKYSMYELATLVSDLTSKKGVLFENQDAEASIYVPSTKNAQKILKVKEKVSLENGLERWIRWLELTKK